MLDTPLEPVLWKYISTYSSAVLGSSNASGIVSWYTFPVFPWPVEMLTALLLAVYSYPNHSSRLLKELCKK